MKLKSNSGYNIGDLDILYWLCFDLVYIWKVVGLY